VVGQPDEVLGEKIVAFVEVAGAPTPADVAAIAATASSALADYKVPERVEVVEKLPRTAAGKIDRAVLRGWARSADHTAELNDSAQPHDYAPVRRNPRTRRKDAPCPISRPRD
jgi:acyl-CoA synthetase (AMP-forming)/AMP-acid ligase II